MVEAIHHLKDAIRDALQGWPWLGRVLASVVDLLSGPLTGENTRYHWVYLAQALFVLAIVYRARHGAGSRTLRDFWRFCFPGEIVRHPSTWVDVKLNVVNFFLGPFFKVAWRLNGAFLTASLVGGLVWAFGPAPHALPWTWPVAIGITVLVGIADDLGYYVFHIASHRISFLWAFHKVHHTAEVLTPLVAGRVHPVEMALSEPVRALFAALVMAPAVYLFAGDISLATVFGINLVAFVFAGFGDQLFHSHVRISWGPVLDRVFVSPAVHQIHHSASPRHWHRNMGGLLSVWDWMFGTLYIPRSDETITYGLSEGAPQIHTGVAATYALPFWDALPVAVRRPALAFARRLAGPPPGVAPDPGNQRPGNQRPGRQQPGRRGAAGPRPRPRRSPAARPRADGPDLRRPAGCARAAGALRRPAGARVRARTARRRRLTRRDRSPETADPGRPMRAGA